MTTTINCTLNSVSISFAEELKRRLQDNTCLQKENAKLKNELDEAKSQLVVADLKVQNDILIEKRKAQEEIASLQRVIHETMEESSCSRKQLDTELAKLKITLSKLQEENALIKSQLPRDPPIDGPQISLSTVTKTIARKVVSQLGADALSLGPDNLEESMRKVKRYVRKHKNVWFLNFSAMSFYGTAFRKVFINHLNDIIIRCLFCHLFFLFLFTQLHIMQILEIVAL